MISLFGRPRPQKPVAVGINPTYAKEIRDLVQSYIDSTAVKSIRLNTSNGQLKFDPVTKLLATKFGGFPYWPKNMKWPMTKQGNRPLVMIAQLNFNYLPKLDGYPTNGILQFFVDVNDPKGEIGIYNGYSVVYHRSPNEKLAIPQEVIPASTFNAPDSPIQGVYYPDARIETSYINYQCDEVYYGAKWTTVPTITEYFNQHLQTNYTNYGSLPPQFRDIIGSTFDSMGPIGGCQIGGWPSCTQNDMRSEDHSQLLLQLDSENGMMWGDDGICNFLIDPKNLKALKFNDVDYGWDCY